ncbi:hypothetical protein VTO42DRAFT_5685 [Malbranchea cinnamomea]
MRKRDAIRSFFSRSRHAHTESSSKHGVTTSSSTTLPVPTTNQTSSTSYPKDASQPVSTPAIQAADQRHQSYAGPSLPAENPQQAQPSTGTSVRDLWGFALMNLSDSERTCIEPVAAQNNKQNVIELLIRKVEEKRQVCESKQWTFQFRGHTWKVRAIAERVMTWLHKFQKVGDLVASIDKTNAALPWSCISFLLELATADSEQMASLLLGLDKILYVIDRCKVYEQLFPDDPSLDQAGKNFTAAMVKLYTCILQFLVKAIRLYEKNTASRFVKAFWDLDEITSFETECNAFEVRVEVEAENCERVYSQIHREESSRRIEELKEHLRDLAKIKDLNESVGRIKIKVEALWKKASEDERDKILSWVSNVPFRDHHEAAFTGLTPGTGEWLFEKECFKQWQSSDKSMILWLHAIGGAGKTKLVSNFINKALNQPSDCRLVYFYCNRNENGRRDALSVLHSFVKQLSISADGSAIQEPLVQIYEAKRKSGFSSSRLNFDECQNLLMKLIPTYSRTTLVLDALDEVVDDRQWLMDLFDYLVGELKGVKILISSRRDDDIKWRLEQGQNLGIDAKDNQDDIAKFVKEKLEKGQSRRRRPISPKLQEEIVRTLLEESRGMFQWAALQIDQLLSLQRESDIRARLGKLPKDLQKAYDELYTQIRESDGSKPEVAFRAFQWIMGSAEPIPPDVLLGAVCYDPDNDTQEEIDIDIDFVLDACRNLVVIDHLLEVCRLSHLSVQEYFENSHGWRSKRIHGMISKVCLSQLNQPASWKETERSFSYSEAETPYSKLLCYAGRFWAEHVRKYWEGPDDRPGGTRDNLKGTISALLKDFFGPSLTESGTAYRRWFKRIAVSQRYEFEHSHLIHEFEPTTSPLPAFCILGLGFLLKELYSSQKFDPDFCNQSGTSLLVLAIIGGALDILQTALEAGAQVNARLGVRAFYCSALEAAVATGRKDMVKLLLEAGADPNLELNSRLRAHTNGLVAAMVSGSRDIVQLLLEFGADTNLEFTQGVYGSVLVAAGAILEDEEVMHLLVKSGGADVNSQPRRGTYGSPLVAASAVGNESVVRTLLELGAHANLKVSRGIYGSALVAAIANDNENVARILLEEGGADPNLQLQSGSYENALEAAEELDEEELELESREDILTIIQQKLQSGTSLPQWQEEKYQRKIAMIQLLKNHGAIRHAAPILPN